MSGTVPGFSLTPQFNQFGEVMPGCRLYIIQAGTTATPQNAYQDSGLTVALPNPLVGDESGRIPQFFLADGLIKLRLTDAANTQQFVGDNLLVIGPSSGGGGGGGGTVDPTTIAATGDFKASFTSDPITGWVRANGRSIGSSISGATERANLDVLALFSALWPNTTLTVSTGKGASAAADWAANKTITLPDLRGRVLSGLDDMGATDSARLTGSSLTTVRLTLGGAGGESLHPLISTEIPSITSSASVTLNSNASNVITGNTTTTLQSGGTGALFQGIANGTAGSSVLPSSGNPVVTSTNTGGNGHNTMQPTLLVTYFIKL